MQSMAASLTEIDVTPVVQAAAYSAGNQVGGIQTLSVPTIAQGRFGKLQSLTVIDIDNQKAVLDVLLFSVLPTVVSTDKTALNIAAAQLTASCVGRIQIAAADYVTFASKAVAFKSFADSYFNSMANDGSLYAVVSTSGTPTYTTVASLVFKWVFAKNF